MSLSPQFEPRTAHRVSGGAVLGRLMLYEHRGERYRLWSVGPDGADDGMSLVYDPTNGTVNAGDIGHRVSAD